MIQSSVQYIVDEGGNQTGVIVPIALWKEMSAEKATFYLLKSDTMKTRLMEAMERQAGFPMGAVREKLGI